MILPIVLITLASFVAILYIWFTEYRLHLSRKQFRDYHRKLYLLDHDIKTLHSNQKVLQSSIKELHKDLRIYGEVKKSRIKTIPQPEA